MRRRLLYLLPLLALGASIGFGLWQPQSASAASTVQGFSYTNGSYVAIVGPEDVNSTTSNTTMTFNLTGGNQYKGSKDGCKETITATPGATSGQLVGSCPITAGRSVAVVQINQTIQIVHAPSNIAPTGTWVDHSEISAIGQTFLDNKIDNNLTFKSTSTDTCTSDDYIDGFPDGNGSSQKNAAGPATLHVSLPSAGGASGTGLCVDYTYNLPLNNTGNLFNDYFAWADSGTISTSDTTGFVFSNGGSGNSFTDDGSGRNSDSTCQSQLTAAPGAATGQLIIRNSGSNPLGDGWPSNLSAPLGAGTPCNSSKSITVAIADPNLPDGKDASSEPFGSSGLGTGGGGTTDDSSTPGLDCQVHFYNPLTWLACPLVTGMIDITSSLDSLINSQLSVGSPGNSDNPSQIFCTNQADNNVTTPTSSCEAYHAAWSSFRDIALGLMAVIALVIVVAQILGYEILDAYAIRKALPRLLIAAVAITLSWSLMQFFVTLTNDLGYGIRFLIYEPFKNAGINTVVLSGGSGSIGILIAGGAVAALSIFGLLSFALTAALAVFIALITLVLRQLVIILLIIVAPIAIVAYILPNTQNLYRLWWDSFAKALLMFPLIAGLIAAGHIFAAVATESTSNPIGQLIGFVAYFAPYFLIPATFKFAGGALRQIGGFVNDRNRGAFDRLRNYRGKKFQERSTNAARRVSEGNTFKRAGANTLRGKINRGLQGATMLGEAGFNPRNMRTNLRTAMNDDSDARVAKFMQESASFGAWSGDDAKNSAAQFEDEQAIGAELARFDPGRYAGAANANRRKEAVSQIMRTQREIDAPTLQKARIRAQSKTGTGYQYVDENGQTQFDASRMLDDINAAYGNDANGAGRALAEMRSNLAQSGQIAGVAGFGTWAQALDGRRSGRLTNEQAHNMIMDNAIDSANPAQAIYGKPSSAAAFGEAHARRIQGLVEGVQNGTASQRDLDQALASAMGIHDAMAQASPQNARAMADRLMNAQIVDPVNGGSISVYDFGNAPTTVQNDGYVHMRRDFSNAAERAAAEARGGPAAAAASEQPGAQPGGLPRPPV